MFRLWPDPGREIDDDELAAIYAMPEPADGCHVRVNFVSSADGAVTVNGRSGGLGSPADRKVFGLLRQMADVVLVGAGTVRAENYRGARKPTRGKDHPPPIAVISASADLDPAARLFTDTSVPPILLTVASAPADKLQRLTAAGAEIVVVGEHLVEPKAVLDVFARRGLHRVLCEGGPRLHGELVAADAVDELCLTVAAVLAGGDAGRIALGRPTPARPMRLASVLTEADALLLRYQRAEPVRST